MAGAADGEGKQGQAAGPAVSRPGWLSPSTRALAGATISPGVTAAPTESAPTVDEPPPAGATVDATAVPPAGEAALEATMAATGAGATGGPSSTGGVADTRGAFLRTTVLPRKRSSEISAVAAPGQNVRFSPVRALGEGGVGEVVLVEDQDIERKVAVKRLRPELRNQAALERFAEEVRIIGQLEHPNITPVHDVGVDEQGHHYFVMKYVEGQTLEAIVEKLRAGDPATVKRFTPEHRAELLLGVLHAVSYAHARGVIHRDLKPSNIMIGPFGEVTVMDWGIAKKVGGAALSPEGDPTASTEAPAGDPRTRTRTQQGQLIGTPLYMSPEQARGEIDAMDGRSDVYSLGIVFFELLCLEHPYAQQRTVLELIATIATRKWNFFNIGGPWLKGSAPCEWREVVLKAIQLDPKDRYQTVDEMAAAMHAVLSGKIAVTCHITLTKRVAAEATHWIDRHPILFDVLFLGALGGAGYGLFSAARSLIHLMR